MSARCRIALLGPALLLACAAPDPLVYGETANSEGDGHAGDEGPAICGDGTVQKGEECDDGDDDDFDLCHDDCTLPGHTRWMSEIAGRPVMEIAPVANRVFFGGSLDEAWVFGSWLGAIDRTGALVEDWIYDELRMEGLAVVDDTRLVWTRSPGDTVSTDICGRDIENAAVQCAAPVFEQKPVILHPFDHGFGRVASSRGWFQTAAAYEVGVDGSIVDSTKLAVEGTPDPLHAFAPDGHVFGYHTGARYRLQWTDEDGNPTQSAELEPGIGISDLGIVVAPDGSVGLLARNELEASSELRVVAPGGELRWSMAESVPIRDLAFAQNGDLFTVEQAGFDEITLSRHGTDGELAWTRTWTEQRAKRVDVLEAGPDGTLYIGGTVMDEGPGIEPCGFVRAVTP